MAPEGTEHPQQNSGETAHSHSGGAESGARPDLSPIVAPELAGLIDAWADLPEPVRRGILAMAEASKGPAE
ncbi:hypothetical protein [Roseovarius sp.]|uniref:hypothetical protein n=1 Tax=Roseovarius sp. TaxID=1486281 RepID=UPI0035635DB4